ncbi:Ribosomal protein L9/RNase H1, N-terminal [Sesbania bispinosa]|nr:Ribosomal protein L9/RNase H1, N-terminal [Sesbania bispinosa]
MQTRPTSKTYVVYRGRQPGIYFTWEECQEQVNEYSGASFRSFFTSEEAEVDWMRYLGRVALYRTQLHANLAPLPVYEDQAEPDEQPVEMTPVNGVPVVEGVLGFTQLGKNVKSKLLASLGLYIVHFQLEKRLTVIGSVTGRGKVARGQDNAVELVHHLLRKVLYKNIKITTTPKKWKGFQAWSMNMVTVGRDFY